MCGAIVFAVRQERLDGLCAARDRPGAVRGRLRASGFIVWVAWIILHLAALTGFKNLISVLFGRTIAFLSDRRAERVITKQQSSPAKRWKRDRSRRERSEAAQCVTRMTPTARTS
jgi:hypothetical protein